MSRVLTGTCERALCSFPGTPYLASGLTNCRSTSVHPPCCLSTLPTPHSTFLCVNCNPCCLGLGSAGIPAEVEKQSARPNVPPSLQDPGLPLRQRHKAPGPGSSQVTWGPAGTLGCRSASLRRFPLFSDGMEWERRGGENERRER